MTFTQILEDIDFICQTDSTSYPTSDKTRNANRWYYKGVTDILKSAGRLQFDDTNLSTLPEVTFDLVSGQADYSNPADLLKLHAIEIKDNGGNWIRLQEIDFQSDLRRTISDFEETDGTPRYYDQGEGSFKLYPAPLTGSVTLTGGGKVHLSREVDIFTTADTTQEPGFAEPFHRIVSLGASVDWMMVHNPDKVNNWLAQLEQLRTEMREFYADKNRDVKTSIKTLHTVRDYI